MRILLASLMLVSIAHAAPTTRKPTSTSSTAEGQSMAQAATTTFGDQSNAYFSTNFIGLSKGNGNINVDLLYTNKMALNFGMSGYANKEKMKPTDTVESTVERNMFNIGATYFVNGINADVAFALNPALAFGTKKNALEVENQNGLGLRATAIKRFNAHMRGELGLTGSNLEGNGFKGDIFGGVGYLF